MGILLLTSGIYAQGDMKFRHLTIENGLSQNSGYCITQDKQGFIWIGTEAGLNKYDGYKIKVYESEASNPNSLSNTFVHSIHIDQLGMFWIGTESGLNRFDPEKEQFTQYLHDPNNSKSLSNNRVLAICEDNNGVLWVGTDRGLNKFEREKEQFTQYFTFRDDPHSISNNGVNILYKDRSGTLWIGTDGGLNKYDQGKNRFIRYQSNPENPHWLSHDNIKSIYEDNAGILWVGTYGGGLNRFDREKEQFIRYKNNPDDPYSLSDNRINAIYEDNSGVLWIGTNDRGVNIFNREKQKFFRYQYNIDNPSGINTNRIISIFEDNTGGIWIGTHGGGINIYHRETQKFRQYTPLGANDVRPIYVDASGILWVGTDGGGLNKFDREREKITLYQHDPKDPNSISDNRVFTIRECHTGMLWIGTHGGGLNKFDREKERFTHYKFDPDDPHSLSDNRIRTLLEDKSEVLWIGTNGGGLNKFDLNNERFTHYKFDPNDPHSLSGNRIYCMYKDRSGNLWIGAFGAGLNRFDREKEQFIRYKADPDNVNSLNDNFVLAIYQDKNGIYWIGTIKGLNKFNRKEKTFIHFTKKDGLPDNVVYDILEDDKGNLWISTNRGLSKLNPKTFTFKNYDVKDGLQSNEFNTGTGFVSKSGEMFFGGVNGFNSFYPDSIRDNPHIPSIVITSFEIFNNSVPIGEMLDGRTILEKSITESNEIILSHKDKVFSFEFAALHYVSPDNNQYAYMMQGLEKEWNFVGSRRFVSYTGIPPGKYTFRVKGSNNDGVWNEEGVSLKIKIIPPFWRTWWFYALSVFVIGVIIASIFVYQMNRLRKQREEEERQKVLDIFNQVLEQGDAAVYRREFDSDHYEYMGDAIKDITGYEASEFTYSFWFKIVIEEELVGELVGLSFDEVYKRVREGKLTHWVMDMRIRTKTGETRWARDMATAIYDEEGRCSACFGILFDITDRKLAEQELARTSEELRISSEQLRVKNNEMEKDLNMAREVQMALLSQHNPNFPENVPAEQSALNFAYRYIPASSLAGDFFEIFPISDHEVGIMIYDVMGHGIRASLLTAYFHGLVEELMPIAADSVAFMKRLNIGLNAVVAQFYSGMFATAFYLVADIKTGKMRYTNAGHPMPFILKRDSGVVEKLELQVKHSEPALGLFKDFSYTASEYKMSDDDIVLLYTDGIFEVEDISGNLFGETRLQNSIQNQLYKAPDQMLDEILREVNGFAATGEFNDDVCAVTVHVRKALVKAT